MNPGHSVKYITPSDKSQTHRDKICDTKILIDPPVGNSRPRLEPVTPAVDPRLCSSQDRIETQQGPGTICRHQKVQCQAGFPLGTCLLHIKASSPQL